MKKIIFALAASIIITILLLPAITTVLYTDPSQIYVTPIIVTSLAIAASAILSLKIYFDKKTKSQFVYVPIVAIPFTVILFFNISFFIENPEMIYSFI